MGSAISHISYVRFPSMSLQVFITLSESISYIVTTCEAVRRLIVAFWKSDDLRKKTIVTQRAKGDMDVLEDGKQYKSQQLNSGFVEHTACGIQRLNRNCYHLWAVLDRLDGFVVGLLPVVTLYMLLVPPSSNGILLIYPEISKHIINFVCFALLSLALSKLDYSSVSTSI